MIQLFFFFFFLARSGNLELLQFLDVHHCDFNLKEKRYGATPLVFALTMKHKDAIQFLAARSNTESLNLALLIVCEEGNLELVKLFVEFGAKLTCEDPYLRMTPLQIASSQGFIKESIFLSNSFFVSIRSCSYCFIFA